MFVLMIMIMIVMSLVGTKPKQHSRPPTLRIILDVGLSRDNQINYLFPYSPKLNPAFGVIHPAISKEFCFLNILWVVSETKFLNYKKILTAQVFAVCTYGGHNKQQ